MPLSCYCPEDIDAEWVYYQPIDYKTMPERKRRARCKSCAALIEPGATVTKWPRSNAPRSDVEAAIYGEDEWPVPLASWWLCEECSDLAFSLIELKFCVEPNENMRELVQEYAELYGPTPKETNNAREANAQTPA